MELLTEAFLTFMIEAYSAINPPRFKNKTSRSRNHYHQRKTADYFKSAVLNFNFAHSPLPIMNFSRSATRFE